MRLTVNGSTFRRHVFAELSAAAILGLFNFQGTIEAENSFRSMEKLRHAGNPCVLSLSLVYSLKEYGASFCHVLKMLTLKNAICN